ncbi:MAG: hypothetical protein AAF393_01995 [Pseudomonadota bacterium]
MTNVSFALFMDRLWSTSDPNDTKELMLQLGFNGLLFQRWSPQFIENWEGKFAEGFLEHYYGTALDQHCAVAKAIHTWTRDYSFREVREQLRPSLDPEKSIRANNLFSQFGMEDGVVLLTGSNLTRSAVILSSATPCGNRFAELGGLLAFAAHRLTEQLPVGHDLLTPVPREHQPLSEMQSRILQMQIDNPAWSNAEMATALGMSPKTLHAHHKKIAKKNGVTTFTGAVLKHLQQSR